MALPQNVTAFFFDPGRSPEGPATGMSPQPTIRIRRISDNTLVVTDDLMTELGDGFYNFDATSIFDEGESYAVRAFAPAIADAREAYKYGTLDSRGFTPSIRVEK